MLVCTSCRNVQRFGLRNTVYGQRTAHREPVRGRSDLRARETPCRVRLCIEPVCAHEGRVAIGIIGMNARRIEFRVDIRGHKRIGRKIDRSTKDRYGAGDMLDEHVRYRELRSRMRGIDCENDCEQKAEHQYPTVS